jgi:protein-disulfide isomerase
VNRKAIALLGAAGLIAAFAAAVYIYKSQRAAQVDALAARYGAPPLVRDHSKTLGPDDARVVIVEFFDPGCETCRVFYEPVKKLVELHDGKVRLVLRYAPFHQGADAMAKALEAARRQGKYWETLQLIYDKQPQWADHHHPRPEIMWEFFPLVGLDLVQLDRDMRDPEIETLLQQDMADANTLGVRKTPTFIVNGQPLERFGMRQLQSLVRTQVAEAYGD